MNAPVPISDSYIGPGGPSVGPRRASRACASCRHDKVRCDGARPCNACAKKGYPGYQCTDGCESCRRARARCEEGEGQHCKRCREMNIHCVLNGPLPAPQAAFANTQQRPHIQGKGDEFETGVQHFSASMDGSFYNVTSLAPDQTIIVSDGGQGKSSRGTERAKLACIACRRDNKKCDDHRPCSRCVTRAEECIHVTRGPKLVKLRCEGCRGDNKKCEELRPCKYCLHSERECVNVPRKGRGHGTRVKSACVSCRRDKIRCNGDRPCPSCVKKGCECIERACPNCTTEGKGSECIHRRSADGASSGSPSSDTSSPSHPKTSSTTTVKEKEFQFVPSQDDSRWISFAASSAQAQTAPILPPSAVYSEQPDIVPPTNGYCLYPESGMSDQAAQLQTPSLTTIMPNHLYGHSSSGTYFFDVFDPNRNYQLAHHMASTSNNRTFL